jgi:hypothetical protein
MDDSQWEAMKTAALVKYHEQKAKEQLNPVAVTRQLVARFLGEEHAVGFDYYQANKSELETKYHGKWIGILNGSILFPSDSDWDLLDALETGPGDYKGVYIVRVGMPLLTYGICTFSE